jgi:hypothetical protein
MRRLGNHCRVAASGDPNPSTSVTAQAGPARLTRPWPSALGGCAPSLVISKLRVPSRRVVMIEQTRASLCRKTLATPSRTAHASASSTAGAGPGVIDVDASRDLGGRKDGRGSGDLPPQRHAVLLTGDGLDAAHRLSRHRWRPRCRLMPRSSSWRIPWVAVSHGRSFAGSSAGRRERGPGSARSSCLPPPSPFATATTRAKYAGRLSGARYLTMYSHHDMVLGIAFPPGHLGFDWPAQAVGRHGAPERDRWDLRFSTGLGHSDYWRSPGVAQAVSRAISPLARYLPPRTTRDCRMDDKPGRATTRTRPANAVATLTTQPVSLSQPASSTRVWISEQAHPEGKVELGAALFWWPRRQPERRPGLPSGLTGWRRWPRQGRGRRRGRCGGRWVRPG